jgi:hypothetical protein
MAGCLFQTGDYFPGMAGPAGQPGELQTTIHNRTSQFTCRLSSSIEPPNLCDAAQAPQRSGFINRVVHGEQFERDSGREHQGQH